MEKCTVIINPTSGKGLNDKLKKKISQILREYHYEDNVIITEYPRHAEEIIKSVDKGLVISVGGDGTFYEVMNGNFERENPLVLSHIPVGTTNDIGHMYGLESKDIISNLKLILEGEVHSVDICDINNRCFVYVASFGKFMDIPYETPQKLKHRLGYMAYMLNVSKELFQKIPQYDITYEIDGVKHHGKYTFVIISNANRIAGINNFYRDMKLDDEKFEVMFCGLKNIHQIAHAFYTLKTSDISYVQGVECYKTDNLKMIFNDNVTWCLDGEKYASDSNIFTLSTKRKVKMLIPNKNVEKLFIHK